MADATQIRITAVDKTTEAFRSVQGNISRMTGSLKGIAGPLAAAFSVASVTAFSREILNAADNLAKLAQKTGVSVEDLSAFQLAADLAGVSSDQFSVAMIRLNRSISEATSGSQKQIEAFKVLGIAQDELQKLSPAQVLERVADAFANAQDGANKTSVAMELLGRSGADLIPLLNGGSQALRQFGTTMNTEFAKNAEVFNDNLRILQENLRRFTINFLGPLVREINQLFGTPAGKELDKAIESAERRVRSYNEQIAEQLKLTPQITAENSFVFRKLLEGATKAQEELKKLEDSRQAALKPPKTPTGQLAPIVTGGVKPEDQAAINLAKEIRDVYESVARPIDIYQFKLNRLNELQAMGVLTSDVYLDRLMQIEEEYENSVPKIDLMNNSIEKGKNGLQMYAEAAQDLRMSLEGAAIRGLQNLEDSLLGVYNGTLNVKDAFRNMAISIINDLLRIQIQKRITGPLAAALDGFFGTQSPAPVTDISIPYGGARALGGTTASGQAYMVGERGPEMFIPGKTGTVVPNNQLGGSGAVVNQTINISTGVSQTVRAEVIGLMPQIMESTKAAVLDAKRRGGTFGKAFA